MYVEAYQGRFSSTINNWPTQLRPFWDKTPKGNPGDWIIEDGVMRCPEAIDKPTTSTAGGAFEPWRTNTSAIGRTLGSYGMIGEQKSPDIVVFKIKAAKPLAILFDSTTENTTPAPTNTYTTGGMSNVATKRHLRVANVAFLDGSVQTYRLPELWAVNWTTTWVPPATLPRVPW
jgi:prepilin-type processing-associated H-X9-DG protein